MRGFVVENPTTKNLSKKYRDRIPDALMNAFTSPACRIRSRCLGGHYTMMPGKYVIFQIDVTQGMEGLAHEMCHFVTVAIERCGIWNFGLKLARYRSDDLPRGYADVLHESEVFARERNLAERLGYEPRRNRDEILNVQSLPGFHNWLTSLPEFQRLHPEQAIKNLIASYAQKPECSANATLLEIRRRFNLLEREPWRIRRKQLTVSTTPRTFRAGIAAA